LGPGDEGGYRQAEPLAGVRHSGQAALHIGEELADLDRNECLKHLLDIGEVVVQGRPRDTGPAGQGGHHQSRGALRGHEFRRGIKDPGPGPPAGAGHGDRAGRGTDVAALPRQARARLRATQVGFVFQSFNPLAAARLVDQVLRDRPILPFLRDDHPRRQVDEGEEPGRQNGERGEDHADDVRVDACVRGDP
jgi:hypothetical protein